MMQLAYAYNRRQCREILSSCVRNTEEAAASGHGKQMKSVWGMIEESELAKSIRAGDELVRVHKYDQSICGLTAFSRLKVMLLSVPGRLSHN